MNANRPFFSVIMPVSNGEKTMNAAICSILTQTFTDYEFIIVENGSTDRSLDIAKAYEASFPNVRVLRSEPRGVSRARNVGLENATGKYAVFLDADDLYTSNALESMRDALKRCSADVLICGFTNFALPATGKLEPLSPERLHLALLDPLIHTEACFGLEEENQAEFALRHQCSRAYLLSFLNDNGIRFDERCPIFVDKIFNKAAYSASKSPYCLYKRLYRYNRTRGSLVRRNGTAFIKDAAKAFAVAGDWLETDDSTERAASVYALFSIMVSMIRSCAIAYSDEAYSMLCEVLQTDTARTVIRDIRSNRLGLFKFKDDLLQAVLKRLRAGDILGSIKLFKEYGGAS